MPCDACIILSKMRGEEVRCYKCPDIKDIPKNEQLGPGDVIEESGKKRKSIVGGFVQ